MRNSFNIMLMMVLSLNVVCVKAADPAAPIEILIAPFLPTARLIDNYQPMLKYLEHTLERNVVLVGSPDYRTFNERILRREYPLLIAVPSSASLAANDAGYVALLRPKQFTRPALVVAKNSPIQRLEEVKAMKIATTDPMGVVAMQGRQMLRDAGLNPDTDVSLKYMENHGVAMNVVLSGEAEAAIVSDRALKQIPAQKQSKLRVVNVWERGAVPGIVYLARDDMPKEEREKITSAILEFVQRTHEGRALMTQFGYGTLEPISASELNSFAPYGAQLKALLQSPN